MTNNIIRKSYPMYMVFPALLFYGLFTLFSNIEGFYLSFTDWNISRVDNIVFIGFDNFARLFKDENFTTAFINVLIFTALSSVFMNGIGLLLALLLNREFRSRNFFRTVFFMPCVISTLVVGYIFTFILNPTSGLLNNILEKIGLGVIALDWLGDPAIALYSVITVNIWMWTGFYVVIYLAGLQTIPNELKESSTIDGANKFQAFKNITFPLLAPALNINFILCIISGLKVFDLVFVLTYGGPGYATEVMYTLMYKAAAQGTLGYASAIGLMQFVVISAITFPALVILRKREVEL